MKAVLSNRIHIEVDEELLSIIDKDLTYKVPGPMPMDPDITVRNMKRIRQGIVSMPSGRVDLIPEDHEIVDKRVLAPVRFPKPLVKLHEYQNVIYNDVDDNCILNAKPGWGKTFVGLFIAAKLGQKTLIVVHNANLRAQWVKEVKKVFGITPGIIGGGKFDVKPIIVIGNTQSLYNKVPEISKLFGTIMLDEMHHVPANSFSKVLDSNHARYKIGLSGTIKRKDGKHVYFRDYFSPTIHKPVRDNVLIPEVHIHKSDFVFPDGGKTPWATRVNGLLYDEEYQKYVANLATIYANGGMKVLVVADRTEFLERGCEYTENSVCITGSITEIEERERLQQTLQLYNSILWGAISIYKEGISENVLSCLILGTPVNNEPMLEQLIGRITRLHEGKTRSIIVDINLGGFTAKKQAQQRLAFYIKEGYKITHY